jgi:hypothetical protein
LTTLTLAAALSAVPASAQIAWDAPSLISPSVPSGFSLFLVDPAGGSLGALGTLRHSAGPVGLGYRAAIAEEAGSGDLAASFGIDIAGMLARGVEGSEVDLAWWWGAGLGIGSETVVSFPLGIVLGWTGSGGEVVLSPYGGGHIVLDIASGPGDDVDLNGAVDLGMDLVLSSGWMIRFGASIGDRESLAFGVRLPTGGS